MASCFVYYYSAKNRKQVIHELGALTGMKVTSDEFVYTLDFGSGYFSVDVGNSPAEPDEMIDKGDYRRFPYLIDIADDDKDDDELVPLINSLLHYFWSNGEAAVAESSFEDQLPFFGGYEKEDMNWPKKGLGYE